MSGALRDGVLRVLTHGSGGARRGAGLLRDDPEETVLVLSSGEVLALRELADGDAEALARLGRRIEGLRAAIEPGQRAHLLVLGGGAPARRLLEQSAQRWAWSAPLTLFHATGAGGVWCSRLWGAGPRRVRPAIAHAVAEAAAALRRGAPLPPLRPDERAALQVPYAEPASEEVAFWQAIGGRRAWVSTALGVTIAAVFGLEKLWPMLLEAGATHRGSVLAGEIWRVFAAVFLHIGVLHLAVNLWALSVLGPFLEKLLGAARFLLLWGLSALAGSLAAIAFTTRPGAGASGALWGLMAGGFALAFRGRGLLPEGVRARVRSHGWQPLVLNTLISFAPGIGLWAHFGGGLAGALLIGSGLLLAGLRPPAAGAPAAKGAVETAFRVAAAILALAMAASVAAAVWQCRRLLAGLE